MAKTWDEQLNGLSVKLAELSKKAADAAGDAKAYRELREEALSDKINTVKGDVAALQENVRLKEEEQEGRIRSALLKARMTIKAKYEDIRDARDKQRIENYLDDQVTYILDCYDAAELLIADAQLSILQVAAALQEYEERFGGGTEE